MKKDDIIEEASALFGVRKQVLAFKDGREVPDDFNLITHMKEKKIVFSSRARACERLYLVMLVTGKVYTPIFTNIISTLSILIIYFFGKLTIL